MTEATQPAPTAQDPAVPPGEAAAICGRLAELAGRPQPPVDAALPQEALDRLAALRVDPEGQRGVLVPVLAATQVTWTAMMALVDALVTPHGHRIIVHAYEDVRLLQPLRSGEVYRSSATLTGTQPSRSGTRAAMTIVAQDSAGRPAVSIVNTAYIRGVWVDSAWGDVATGAGATATSGATAPDGGRPGRRTSFLLSDTVTDEYAVVSGDHNPVHLSDVAARAVGLPSRIVHGLCTYGAVARAVLDEHGLPPDAVTRVWARFRDVVLPGDRLDIDSTAIDDSRRLVAVARSGRGPAAEDCVIELAQ